LGFSSAATAQSRFIDTGPSEGRSKAPAERRIRVTRGNPPPWANCAKLSDEWDETSGDLSVKGILYTKTYGAHAYPADGEDAADYAAAPHHSPKQRHEGFLTP
jgi:hypothetical protein